MKNCILCFKETKRNAQKFCSVICESKYRKNRSIQQWLSGEDSGTRECKQGAAGFIRIYLIELRGECCEICSWNQRNRKTNTVPLELEHKDGNWRNNRIENLQLLCPNCHSLTETFRNLNRGFGRSKRRKDSSVIEPPSCKGET